MWKTKEIVRWKRKLPAASLYSPPRRWKPLLTSLSDVVWKSVPIKIFSGFLNQRERQHLRRLIPSRLIEDTRTDFFMSVFFFFFSFALLNIVKLDFPKLAVVLEARLTDLFSVRVLFKVVVRGSFSYIYKHTLSTESLPKKLLLLLI